MYVWVMSDDCNVRNFAKFHTVLSLINLQYNFSFRLNCFLIYFYNMYVAIERKKRREAMIIKLCVLIAGDEYRQRSDL